MTDMGGPKCHYSFRGQVFTAVSAHGGVGMIRTVRVADESRHRGFNFIDLTEIPPGRSIGMHRHEGQDEEAYVVISGSGTMSLGECEFEVQPGDVVINPANGTHGLVNTGEEVLRLVVLDIPVADIIGRARERRGS